MRLGGGQTPAGAGNTGGGGASTGGGVASTGGGGSTGGVGNGTGSTTGSSTGAVAGVAGAAGGTGGWGRRAKLGDSRSTGRLHPGPAPHRSMTRLNVPGNYTLVLLSFGHHVISCNTLSRVVKLSLSQCDFPFSSIKVDVNIISIVNNYY